MFGMTDLRCLFGFHAWKRSVPTFRVYGRGYGMCVLRRECSRCPAKLVIEGPAAEIKANIRSRG